MHEQELEEAEFIDESFCGEAPRAVDFGHPASRLPAATPFSFQESIHAQTIFFTLFDQSRDIQERLRDEYERTTRELSRRIFDLSAENQHLRERIKGQQTAVGSLREGSVRVLPPRTLPEDVGIDPPAPPPATLARPNNHSSAANSEEEKRHLNAHITHRNSRRRAIDEAFEAAPVQNGLPTPSMPSQPRIMPMNSEGNTSHDSRVSATASARWPVNDFRPSNRLPTGGSSAGGGGNATTSKLASMSSLDTVGSLGDRRHHLVCRLRTRLGNPANDDPITGMKLFEAVSALGLTKYDEDHLERLISQWNEALRRGQDESRRFRRQKTVFSWARDRGSEVLRQTIPGAAFQPSGVEAAIPPRRTVRASEYVREIMFDRLAELLIDPERPLTLTGDAESDTYTIREVLLSGDANRVVAELTNTRVDDLASPPQSISLLTAIEPIVSFMILFNGVLIGVQSDENLENWSGWIIFEVFFVIFFIGEMLLRIWCTGIREHFFGSDKAWNDFDFLIIVLAVMELSVQGNGSSPVLRLVRLTRLSRLLRMFRFQMVRELTLMLKGLLGGFRTLGWAMVLLLSTIYVISLFLTATVGKSRDLGLVMSDAEDYFATVPRSMFTAFRCFTSDCNDSEGRPIASTMGKMYGWQFTVPYILCVMFVTFGIFNLIIAIYIEATMTAAKHNDMVDKKKQDREALRVARATKKLLKKFCAAQRAFSDPSSLFDSNNKIVSLDTALMEQNLSSSLNDDVEDDAMTITKELFLLVVQDKGVQALMDELDIPADRGHLFDILDADGSGDLAVTELVQGLLKVRGEARKTDMVACLLAVRAVQEGVAGVHSDLTSLRCDLGFAIGVRSSQADQLDLRPSRDDQMGLRSSQADQVAVSSANLDSAVASNLDSDELFMAPYDGEATLMDGTSTVAGPCEAPCSSSRASNPGDKT